MVRQDPDDAAGQLEGPRVVVAARWRQDIGNAWNDAAITTLVKADYRVAALWVIAANDRALRSMNAETLTS